MGKEIRNVHINVTSNSGASMKKGTKAATGLGGALKGVGAASNVATGGIKAMAAALISTGIGAVVVAVGALIAGIGGLVNKAKEFSGSLSGLKAILGSEGDDPLKFKELADDAKRLGSETAFTAVEVVALQTEFAKAGFKTDEILNATEATLALAAATGSELSTAAEVAAGTLRGFGLATSETQRVVDVMALSFSSSTLDMGKYQESMKNVAPVAKGLKISIEETTAALGVLANNQISGGIAGTNLRIVMSKLAKATGQDFRTALDTVADKMDKATSDAERMAISQEYVGDRAYSALNILVDQRDALDNLSEGLNGAEGSAQKMADTMLDNLGGDMTKLGSAWEGFMLSLEDGTGVLTKVGRFLVQGLTKSLGFVEESLEILGLGWDVFMIQLDSGGAQLSKVKEYFNQFGDKIAIVAKEIKISLADVPILGGGIDKGKAERELKQLKKQADDSAKIIKELNERQAENKRKIVERVVKWGQDREGRAARDTAILQSRIEDEFREGKMEKDDSAYQKQLENKRKFLEKLKTQEENFDDKSALDKIQRRRERHLNELNELKMNSTEKAEAELRINDLYDGLKAKQEADNRKKFDSMFGTTDPEAQIEKKRAAHLLELENLTITETEKEELKLRIKEHYDAQIRDLDQKALDDKKKNIEEQIAQEKRLRDEKTALLYSTLDTAASVAGEETDIARALQAIKLAMQLQELGMKMGILKDELKIKAQAAISEAGIEGAKVGTATAQGMAETSKIGFPWNIITMASYALQAATLIKSFAKSKKTLSSIASSAGGTGGGGGATVAQPIAPSFNVIGQTSAGDNMVANTIASVNSNPMRAYVVSSDVTSQQSLQRNTESLASIDE